MHTLLGLVGATVAGAIGWWPGAFVGFTTAFLLSPVASGVGYYYGRRLAGEHLP